MLASYLRGMGGRRWILLIVALVMLATLFFPWVLVESRNIAISGLHAEGTSYGKPGLLNLFFASIVALFALVPRVWAHRLCLFCAAFNIGWSVRNFLILSMCQGGECPQRQPVFYLYLTCSFLLLGAVLIQQMKLKQEPTAA